MYVLLVVVVLGVAQPSWPRSPGRVPPTLTAQQQALVFPKQLAVGLATAYGRLYMQRDSWQAGGSGLQPADIPLKAKRGG